MLEESLKVDLDPRGDPIRDGFTSIGELKKVQIGDGEFQFTQIGLGLFHEDEAEIIRVLKGNVDLFIWKPSDMPWIYPSVECHKLSLDPTLTTVM